ncbi:MAG: Fe2+-enterobactin ABC transporter substrate-binding protein, partial [Actinomycetes bacterium]
GKLLQSFGLRLADLGDAGGGLGISGGPERKDVIGLAHENASRLGDSSIYVVNADGASVAGYRDAYPALAALPAFAEGRVFALGPESFRLDRFAALAVLERLASAG